VGVWSTCTRECDRVWSEAVAQSGHGRACPSVTQCQPGDDLCPPSIDCAGQWSACSASCEAAGVRTWGEYRPQLGTGIPCPAAQDCQPGDGCCVPALQIVVEPAQMQTPASQHTRVAAIATPVQLCDTSVVSSSLTYRWSAVDGDTELLDFAQDTSVFEMPPYTLRPGTTTLRVSVDEGGQISSADVVITVASQPLFVTILGGNNRAISASQDLRLDASESHDPDLGVDERLTDGLLSYTWSCTAAGVACSLSGWDLTAPVLEATRAQLASASHGQEPLEFVVTVEKPGKLPVSATTVVTIVAGAATVNIARTMQRRVNSNEKFSILGTISAPNSVNADLYEWRWSAELESGLPFSLSPEMVSTPTNGYARVSASVSVDNNLVVRPDVLTPGQSYAFVLTAESSTGAIGFQELLIETNRPPSGGLLTVLPAEGRAIEMSFLLSTDGWTDEDEAVGFRYRFGYTLLGNDRYLQDFTASPSTRAVLPQGPASTDHAYPVHVSILDAFGGLSSASTVVRVLPMQAELTQNSTRRLLSAAESVGDVSQTAQLIDALAGALSSREVTTATDEIRESRELLVEALATQVLTPDTDSGVAPLALAADAIGRLGSSLELITSSPIELTVAATDTAATLVNILAEAGALSTGTFPVEGIAGAISNLLSAMSIQNDATSRTQQSDNRGDGIDRGMVIAGAIDNLGDGVVNQMVNGEAETLLRTDNFDLWVQRDSPGQFEERTLAGLVRVPSAALTVAAGQTVTSQIIQYSGLGPLFAAPETLIDGTGSQLASSLLSVDFKYTSTPVEGRRVLQSSGAQTLEIANLSEPFIISIPLVNTSRELNFSKNMARKSLEEVDKFISFSWNRTSLEEEMVLLAMPGSSPASGCSSYLNDSNFSMALQQQADQLQRQEEEKKTVCPRRTDSCANSKLKEDGTMIGCPGIRGGAEDCHRWPEACACMREELREKYVRTVSELCVYWDEELREWRRDGEFVNVTNDSLYCAFDHLTNFAAMLGPPVSFNRMDVEAILDKEWLKRNPVSAIIALVTTLLSLVSMAVAIKIYQHLVRKVSTAELLREQYELRSSRFARKRQLLSLDNVSIFHKLAIDLRIQWPLAAIVLGYRGDPYLKSHRFVVVWLGILIGKTALKICLKFRISSLQLRLDVLT
jgi:hypothetical protein